MLKRITWQQRCAALLLYNEEHELSCRELAEEFNYSKSQISTDLTLGYAIRVYPELEEVENYIDAIAFVKMKGFHRKLNDGE